MTGLGRGEDRPPMYGMEELVPLVGKLADRYNGYEDTSVTYEKAQQLMGAIVLHPGGDVGGRQCYGLKGEGAGAADVRGRA